MVGVVGEAALGGWREGMYLWSTYAVESHG